MSSKKVTMEDVLKVYIRIDYLVKMFGCAAGFLSELDQERLKFVQAVAEEHGIKLEEVVNLPLTTELGEKGLATFEGFKAWARGQHGSLKDL